MPVSGLVVTFRGDEVERRAIVASLSAHKALSVGDATERWIPLAMEARDDRESRDLHDWIASLPGVEFVDVVSVDFGSDESPSSVTDNAQ